MLSTEHIKHAGIGSVRNDIGITGLTQLNFRFKALKKNDFYMQNPALINIFIFGWMIT